MYQMVNKIPGVLLAAIIALGAKFLVSFIGTVSVYWGQIISPTIVAIILGIIIQNTVGVSIKYKTGVEFASKYILMLAIVLLGATLDFQAIVKLFQMQPGIIFLIIFNICLAFSTAYGIGRLMKIDFPLSTFIGGGCSICGGTTITTLGPIIKAKESEIALGISIIFSLDMITIMLYPALASMLHLSPEAFGILAGTAINDTSSVLAAGDIYSKVVQNNAAYETASIVKLTRTSFLVIVATIFSVFAITRHIKTRTRSIDKTGTQSDKELNIPQLILKTFPWFVACFVLMSILHTAGIFHNSIFNDLARFANYEKTGLTPAIVVLFRDASKFLIILALAAVGLKSNLKALFAPGHRPILLGAVTAFVVFVTSLTTISFFLY
jgi:uncharacterized integral membrane protein (TIGR00698 family)